MSKNPALDTGPDPGVIAMISQAAAQTGADPVALLATSLREDNARFGVMGDNGTSAGAFQFHRGGALGNHPFSWADTYPAFLNRAQEFARLGVHGGPGAAAVQRPADPQAYAQGVNSLLGKARALLHEPPAHTGGPLNFDHGLAPGSGSPLDSLAPTSRLAAVNAIMSGNVGALASLVQQAGGKGASPSAAHSAVSSPGGGAQPLAGSPAPAPTSHQAGTFEGTKVAAWMVPALQYARQHGWKGTLTSGVRTTAEQAVLYARYRAGGNIAARPGQSNHELQNGGAFDATDAPQLAQILKGFTGQRPIWAPTVGLNDTPHFSLTGR